VASVGSVGFAAEETGEKDLAQQKKSFQVDYKVYSPENIQETQTSQIDEVAMITDLPTEEAAILLRYGRWNKEKLIEKYMEDQEKMLDDAGIGRSSRNAPPRFKKTTNFECQICCLTDDHETFGMKCGHRFCTDDWKHYVSQKIKEEGEAARIRCPGEGCDRIVDSKSLDLLLEDDLRDRYVQAP
jgi:ariadne-1